jgi:hypothetical protein
MRAVAVLNICGMDAHAKQEAEYVDEDVALAARERPSITAMTCPSICLSRCRARFRPSPPRVAPAPPEPA